jgi:hypothetical protein
MGKEILHLKPNSNQTRSDLQSANRSAFELYQAFMLGYVRRINEATLNVTIGGVRIGSAKYSRLAQINLQSRIITFSRFAVENVPERGRRYLVLHELAHVKEANHNRRFWGHVEKYEPNYRKVSRELELAFRRNVKEDLKRLKELDLSKSQNENSANMATSLSARLLNYKLDVNTHRNDNLSKAHSSGGPSHALYEEELINGSQAIIDPLKYRFEQRLVGDEDSESFECMEDEFSSWYEASGTVFGGFND